MTDTARQTLLRRIQALLAKSAGTDSQHEADAFAEKARALMEQHQIEQHELGQDADPLGDDFCFLRYDAHCYIHLAQHASLYFGCHPVFRFGVDRTGKKPRRRRGFQLFGRESARTTAQVMIEYWTSECMRRGRRLHREQPETYTSESTGVRMVMEAMAIRLMRATAVAPARPGRPGLPVPQSEAETHARSQMQLHDMKTRGHGFTQRAADEAAGISLALQAEGRTANSRRIA